MNNKKKYHPSMREKMKKLLTLFIIIVLIFVGVGVYYAKDLGVGYKYYEIKDITQTIEIGVTQQEDIISVAIDEYLNELEKEGYYVASHQLNMEILYKQAIIHKVQINDEELKSNIIKGLDVDAFLTKVKIKNDDTDYYFKSETEAKEFINRLNKYIEQDYELESVIDNIKLITAEDKLNEKEQSVIEQKERQEQQEKQRLAKVTSRGGTSRRQNNGSSSTAPLKSYSYISSPYGMRNGRMHTGTDFAAATGTPIYAWKSGTVTQASWNGGYGNFIEIKHSDGTVSRYAHLSKYAISSGQEVHKGQVIGYVGSTGNSTGPHLHFELKINGNFVNPMNYL